jgi:hypothetical protein
MKKAAFPAPERAHGNEKHNAIFDLSGAKKKYEGSEIEKRMCLHDTCALDRTSTAQN